MSHVISLIDENVQQYDMHLSSFSKFKIQKNKNLTWVEGLGYSSRFTGVLETHMIDENIKDIIKNKIHYFEKKNTSFFWRAWKSSIPENLGELLEELGFKKSGPAPGMAINIHSEFLDIEDNPDFKVIIAEKEEDIRSWIDIVFKGFNTGKEEQEIFKELFREKGFSAPAIHLLGFYKEVPVCTTSVFIGNRAGGLYWISTLEEFRGKGLGALITAHALKVIASYGLSTAVLQSSSLGFPVYTRLGFKKYCEYFNYSK